MSGTQEMVEEGGTQPMEDLGASGALEDSSWAKLMPIDSNFTAVHISDPSATFGRQDPAASPPDAHHYIGSSEWEYNAAISKKHFRISLDETERGQTAWITDLSSNGTFVNGDRIPKGAKRPLPPNAEIAIALARNKARPNPKRRTNIPVFIFYTKDPAKVYPPDLESDYVITRELGRGAMGTVMRGFRKADGESVAVKEVQKNKFNPTSTKQLEREVEILKAIRHPACIQVENVFEDAATTYIVMEIVEGGELFDRIIANKRLPEPICKLYAIQMLEAIKYLHDAGIVHRDLKPENILVKDPNNLDSAIKVSDFGLSKMFDSESMMRTFCGTPNYLAPEIVKSNGCGAYTKAVDLWSLGVIVFVCLSGYPPFSKDYKDMSLEKQITTGRMKFVEREWTGVSPAARDFVKALIVVDTEARLTAEAALAHPWIAGDADARAAAQALMFPTANGATNGRCAPLRKRGVKATLGGDEMEVENPNSQPKRLK